MSLKANFDLDKTKEFPSCLTSVIIPEGITSIGNNAFDSCTSLTDVTIPNSVTEIGLSAFYWCISLTEINLPNNLTTIRNNAFGSCRSLTSIKIPNTVTEIESAAFEGCTSLQSIKIPYGITTINQNTFSYCTELTDVEIDQNVAFVFVRSDFLGDGGFSDSASAFNHKRFLAFCIVLPVQNFSINLPFYHIRHLAFLPVLILTVRKVIFNKNIYNTQDDF